MASLRAPAHASSFARGVAVRSQRASVAAVRPAGQRKGSVQVSAFFNFLQPKEEDEERAVAVQKSICLDCGYIAGACPHQHVRALWPATLSVRRA
jgi:hypothetical protein